MSRVAVLGLGTMGAPIAGHLAAAGHSVQAWNRGTHRTAPTQSGEEKARAAQASAAGGRILAAFGDTAADIPLLKLAERAVAVAPDSALALEAARMGWERLG